MTSPEDVERTIVELLAEVKESDPEQLRGQLMRKGVEMPVDSLDTVEILIALEDRFGVRLPVNKKSADAFRSVASLSKLVCELSDKPDKPSGGG